MLPKLIPSSPSESVDLITGIYFKDINLKITSSISGMTIIIITNFIKRRHYNIIQRRHT
jgi:hypothetical protein